MAPKKKHIAEKTKIQPPEVPDDKVEQAVKLLQDKDVKEKCRQSMYYALQIGGKKQEYDASDGAAKKRYAICWAASQLGNIKIFGTHTHSSIVVVNHNKRTKNKKVLEEQTMDARQPGAREGGRENPCF